MNPVALRKAKIVYNFGLSECNRVKRKINVLSKDINIIFFAIFFYCQSRCSMHSEKNKKCYSM